MSIGRKDDIASDDNLWEIRDPQGASCRRVHVGDRDAYFFSIEGKYDFGPVTHSSNNDWSVASKTEAVGRIAG